MLGQVADARSAQAGGSIGADRPRRGRGATARCATSRSTRASVDHATRSSPASRPSTAPSVIDDHRPHVPDAPSAARSTPALQASRSRRRDDLSMAYTPGVARVCTAIAEDPDKAFQYTIKRNTVAVVSDGTAVLGLGDIGPEAAMPVMEGKAMLFKEFAGVDAFPICLDTKDPDEIVETVKPHRAGLRRHQPRGHLRAALLRDRGAPQGRARHPGLPRRPARHRDRHARRADQRLPADRPAARGPARC